MTKGLSLAFYFFALINITPVFAETIPDENAAKVLANKIMAEVVGGNLDGAFAAMKPYAPFTGTEMDSIAMQIKTAREQFGARYGSPIAFEFVDSKQVGNSLLRLRYIEKTKNTAMPWNFYFYKNKEGWILSAFEWKDTFKELFQLN